MQTITTSSVILILSLLAPLSYGQEANEEVAAFEQALLRGDQIGELALQQVSDFGWSTYTGENGIVVAEGDSWFAYPNVNVLKILERVHQYEVEEVADNGDTLESMAYDENQFTDLADLLNKLSQQRKKPKAILISGGGNDIAGPEFRMLLNHLQSKSTVISDPIASELIDVRLRNALITLLQGITTITKEYWGEEIPILVHGYDYPIPDGRSFYGLAGPWLKPSFREKGYTNLPDYLETGKKALVELIGRYNQMLAEVVAAPQFRGHVHYVKLTSTLSSGKDYQDDWHNELHPSRRKNRGFYLIAAKMAAAIEESSHSSK